MDRAEHGWCYVMGGVVVGAAYLLCETLQLSKSNTRFRNKLAHAWFLFNVIGGVLLARLTRPSTR